MTRQPEAILRWMEGTPAALLKAETAAARLRVEGVVADSHLSQRSLPGTTRASPAMHGPALDTVLQQRADKLRSDHRTVRANSLGYGEPCPPAQTSAAPKMAVRRNGSLTLLGLGSAGAFGR